MESGVEGMWAGGLFLLAIGIALLMLWAETNGEMRIKKEAKKLGYMQLIIDQETGKTKLEWK